MSYSKKRDFSDGFVDLLMSEDVEVWVPHDLTEGLWVKLSGWRRTPIRPYHQQEGRFLVVWGNFLVGSLILNVPVAFLN